MSNIAYALSKIKPDYRLVTLSEVPNEPIKGEIVDDLTQKVLETFITELEPELKDMPQQRMVMRTFEIYVTEKENIEGKKRINGIIVGCYGIGNIRGDIDPISLNLTVTYDPDIAKQGGAPQGKTVYKGDRVKEAYIGDVKWIVDGLQLSFGNRVKFGMKPYNDKKMIQDRRNAKLIERLGDPGTD